MGTAVVALPLLIELLCLAITESPVAELVKHHRLDAQKVQCLLAIRRVAHSSS